MNSLKLLIVGAGTMEMACAIIAAENGAKVAMADNTISNLYAIGENLGS